MTDQKTKPTEPSTPETKQHAMKVVIRTFTASDVSAPYGHLASKVNEEAMTYVNTYVPERGKKAHAQISVSGAMLQDTQAGMHMQHSVHVVIIEE